MKKPFIPVIAALASLSVLAWSAETPAAWTKVATMHANFLVNIAGFMNRDYALTVGYAGEVHVSRDGGTQWPRGHNNSMCRFGLEIVDANVAYHCGNGGQVGKTVDGGKNWTPVKTFPGSEPRHARYLAFSGPDEGWIASPFSLGSTTDGGASWNKLTLPKGMGKILAIASASPAQGALLDERGDLWTTTDGSATWTKTKAVEGEFMNGVEFTSVACLRYVDAGHLALAFYRLGDNPGWVVRESANAGASWSERSFAGVYANPWLDRSARFLTTTDSVKKEVTLYQLQ